MDESDRRTSLARYLSPDLVDQLMTQDDLIELGGVEKHGTVFFSEIVGFIDMAENLKRYGGFIPGMRPGRPTAEYLDRIMTRITLPGAMALAGVAVLPVIISNGMGVSFLVASFFGGTGLLIVVGVALDTVQQIESHLLMRHYDGFFGSTGSRRVRGRRGRA